MENGSVNIAIGNILAKCVAPTNEARLCVINTMWN